MTTKTKSKSVFLDTIDKPEDVARFAVRYQQLEYEFLRQADRNIGLIHILACCVDEFRNRLDCSGESKATPTARYKGH
jgi:hypothetical protein